MYARHKSVEAFLSLCDQEGYDFQAKQVRVLKNLQEGSAYSLGVVEEGNDTFYGVRSSQAHTLALLAAAIMAWPRSGPTCSSLNDGFSACGMRLRSYRSFKKWSRMAKVDHWGQVFERRNPTPHVSPVICAFPITAPATWSGFFAMCHYYDGLKLWKSRVQVNLSSFMLFLWGNKVMVM